jgi:hypothetical protein
VASDGVAWLLQILELSWKCYFPRCPHYNTWKVSTSE